MSRKKTAHLLFVKGGLLPSESLSFSFTPIGHLESCYKDKFGVPRQSGLVPEATARLVLRPDLQPEAALQGLEGFSHVWLIWVFHENKTGRYHAKVHPPRLGGENVGVFATRSPHRPNPLGLSLVELKGIENGALLLSGVDLMDGTPILDLKPYLGGTERPQEFRLGWAAGVPTPDLQVSWASEAEAELSQWERRLQAQGRSSEAQGLRSLIEQSIRQDPRPLVYRGDPDSVDFQRRINHAFRIYDGDVHFRMTSETTAQVFKILEMNDEFSEQNLRKFAASTKSASKSEGEGSDGNNRTDNGRGSKT